MTTYAVFPGLEALMQASKSRRWLGHREVARTLEEVSGYLAQLTGQSEDISRFINDNHRPHLTDLDRMFIGHVAIQVGIAREVFDEIQVDGLVGCSIGDLARLHLSGALTLPETVDLAWYCAMHRRQCPPGRMANVRPLEGRFTDDQLDWLASTGISLSLWSDRHAALAASDTEIDAVVAPAAGYGLKIRKVYDYPFHSSAMLPLAERILADSARWDVRPAHTSVFSSVWLRALSSPEETAREALAGATQPVLWKETIDRLHREHGVSRLLNIGPSDTVTAWIADSPEHGNLTVVEAWDLTRCDVTAV